jgi:amino acid transporter
MSSPSPTAGATHEHDEDTAQLASLGYSYDQSFKREMSFWGNVSLGFTYLSPIVGVFSVFAFSMGAAGPPMVWSLVIAFLGQLMVALVFGQVVSNYPVAGGLYPWSRRLWGRKWAWMNGWIYLLAMIGTIAGVVFGSAPFTLALLGLEVSEESLPITYVILALLVLLIATILNVLGTRVLNWAATIGLIAEMIGAVVIGVLLLTVYRQQDFSALFETFGAAEGQDYFLAFAAAGLIGLFAYYGFEANGNVAEEIKDPSRRVPKAMRTTLYIGGFAATFIAIALTLAMSDDLIAAVIAGENADPIGTVLADSFGEAGSKLVLIVVLIAFVSCATSLQAAVSRLTYSMARDGIFPASGVFGHFNQKRAVPTAAVLLAAVLAAILVVVSLFAVNALFAMIGFGTIGIYIAFQMVVLASLRASLLGWKPAGKFALGAWNIPVTLIALIWGILAIINIGWPRGGDWIVLTWTAVIIGVGLLYLLIAKPHLKGNDAPHGDATGAVKTVD